MDMQSVMMAAAIAKQNIADPEVVADVVEGWLDSHPEATTTVQDGAITRAKLHADMQAKVDAVATLETAVAGKLAKPSGNGMYGQVLQSNGDGTTAWADAPEGGGSGAGVSTALKNALLQIALKAAYIDGNGPSYYQALYNALNASGEPAVLSSISASLNLNGHPVYSGDSLDSLKPYLTVTAAYSDSSTAAVPAANYTLSGTLTAGTSTVTVTYSGKTATFTVSVSAVTLSSISPSLNLSGHTVYEGDSLDSLKPYLTVTAAYSDSSTATVSAANYTLSGTLTAGTSTITVSYGGKTTTFTVSVSAPPVTLSSISASLNLNGHTVHANDSLDSLKTYLTVTAAYSDSSTSTVAAADYTLSGTLAEGTSTVTVTCSGKTTTFNVSVSAAALPAGYTRLQYVGTGSGQYIDTGVIASHIGHAKYDVMYTSASSKGGRVLSSRMTFFPFFKTGTSGAKQISGKYWGSETVANGGSNAFEWELNTRYMIEGFLPEVKVDGVTLYTMTKGDTAGSGNAFIGLYQEQPENSNYWFNGKIYSVKIYDANSALLADFVPCKNSGNVAGLYDLVGDSFYASASGTDFTAGEAVA